MGSKICLLNAGPTGAETLKNLVLPGCGYVCVVDGSVVTDADCANNFFVSRERLGQPRAQAVLELLLELNDDVAGSYVAEAPSSIRLLRPDFFREFSIVIASQLPLAELRLLAAVLAPHCIPLLVRRIG
jgi:amyloid beta precursor protein binding protein 1